MLLDFSLITRAACHRRTLGLAVWRDSSLNELPKAKPRLPRRRYVEVLEPAEEGVYSACRDLDHHRGSSPLRVFLKKGTESSSRRVASDQVMPLHKHINIQMDIEYVGVPFALQPGRRGSPRRP